MGVIAILLIAVCTAQSTLAQDFPGYCEFNKIKICSVAVKTLLVSNMRFKLNDAMFTIILVSIK